MIASGAWRRVALDDTDLLDDVDERFPTLLARAARADELDTVTAAGALADVLARHVTTPEAPTVSVLARAFYRTREALCEATGVPRELITPGTRFDALLPSRRDRREIGARVRERLRGRWMPWLTRPPHLNHALLVLTLAAGAGMVRWQWTLDVSGNVRVFGPLAGMVAFAVIASLVTRRSETEFVHPTVGDFARALIASGADILALPHDRLTPAQIDEVMRELAGRYLEPTAST